MNEAKTPNEEQLEYWNGEAGERWAQQDELMAGLLQPIAESLLDHAAVEGASRAIDIGCGGGSQSLLLARRLGEGASVLGVDISGPLLNVARERAAAAPAGTAALDFVQADAASHAFEPGEYDLLFSRFGVMFFEDPRAAFSNLRGALGDSGRVAFCCWQSLQDNPWVWLAVQAALRFVPPPEPMDPEAPGPFSFANPGRLESILSDAGFANIEIANHPVNMKWRSAETLQENVAGMIQIGPVGRLVMDQPAEVRQQVQDALVEIMREFYDGSTLDLPGATWFVTASVQPG